MTDEHNHKTPLLNSFSAFCVNKLTDIEIMGKTLDFSCRTDYESDIVDVKCK